MHANRPTYESGTLESPLHSGAVQPAETPVENVRRVPCRVLVASGRPGAEQALARHMMCRLEVVHLEHIGQLMEAAPQATEERVALVIDCSSPTMHPTSVAALADELPYGWWVVAWGIDELTWEELEPDRNGNLHWVRCPEGTPWDDVASLVATVLAAGH